MQVWPVLSAILLINSLCSVYSCWWICWSTGIWGSRAIHQISYKTSTTSQASLVMHTSVVYVCMSNVCYRVDHYLGMNFASVAVPLAAIIGSVVATVEYFAPWSTEVLTSNTGNFLTAPSWPPIVSGTRQQANSYMYCVASLQEW